VTLAQVPLAQMVQILAIRVTAAAVLASSKALLCKSKMTTASALRWKHEAALAAQA